MIGSSPPRNVQKYAEEVFRASIPDQQTKTRSSPPKRSSPQKMQKITDFYNEQTEEEKTKEYIQKMTYAEELQKMVREKKQREKDAKDKFEREDML